MAASAASSTQDKDPDSGLESTASVSSLSSSVNEQGEVKRRKLIFYNDFPDGALKFSGGETLKVNMAVLSLKSKVFHGLFKKSAPPDHLIEIADYSLQVFKTFINCLLDLEECTFDKAFKLLPIACKYETSEFIKRCVDILTPTKKDLAVCLSLNLATSWCKCTQLEDAVIKFLVDTRYIHSLFSKEHLYMFLEPESMVKLLTKIQVDSYVLRAIFNWGDGYLKTKDNYTDLKTFFDETKISDFITVFSFESIPDLVDFNESKPDLGYFTPEEIDCFKKINGECGNNRKVSWFDIKAGDVLVEKLVVKEVVFSADNFFSVKLNTCPVVFYEYSERSDGWLILYECTYKILSTGAVRRKRKCVHNEQIHRRSHYCDWVIDPKMSMTSDLEIQVKATFYVDCRISKAFGKKLEIEKNDDKLYWTDSIELKLVEKRKKNIEVVRI